jgi:hypothetical protein
VQGLDVICVDTPSGEVAKKSSSYDLSIFSSRADSQGAEVIVVASEDSSPSIVELWPNIDELDEIRCEDTSAVHTYDVSVRGRRSTVSARNPCVKAGRRSRCKGGKALLMDVVGSSNIKSKRRGGSSMKKEAT